MSALRRFALSCGRLGPVQLRRHHHLRLDVEPQSVHGVRVEALSRGAIWTSPPDSGYSVDNIAPPTPAPFLGTYSAGTSSLTWGAVTASDLAGYRLYRGNSALFTPNPSNLVIETNGLSYVDAGAGP